MSILVVDDSHESRRLLEVMLQRRRYEVVMAASAQEAFQHLRLDVPGTSDSSVDLVLMDIMMPGMNGIEACQRIKAVQRFHDLPVIMVTSKQEPQALEAAFAVGARDYIRKPIKRLELLSRVQSALLLKRESDARKACEQELVRWNQELERALREIKTLQGFLLICLYCKRVQADHGQWERIETYLKEHGDVQLHPVLCATCEGRLS
jgi:CheY-like chemotaxis protein